MTKEKLAEICFHFGDLDETSGKWRQIFYNLEELKDKKYIVIAPVWSAEMGYEVKGENDLDVAKEVILEFEKARDEEEDEDESVEVFDVTENKFLNYDIKLEKSVSVKWNGFV
jgi:hypothetical protein